jgi:hypothetical protein
MFTCAYESSPGPPIVFREDSFNIPPSLPESSKCSVFLCFHTETLMHFYFPAYVPYAPTILSALFLLPE